MFVRISIIKSKIDIGIFDCKSEFLITSGKLRTFLGTWDQERGST